MPLTYLVQESMDNEIQTCKKHKKYVLTSEYNSEFNYLNHCYHNVKFCLHILAKVYEIYTGTNKSKVRIVILAHYH